MTDVITTAHVTSRRPAHSTLRFPKLGFGRALVRILEEFGHAFNLAYVQPLRLGRSQSPIVLEGSEKGRDPSW